jgi:hypothetical protein
MAPGNFAGSDSDLFTNIRVPAALVAGAVISLGYQAASRPNRQTDRPNERFLKLIHSMLCVVTLFNELIAVVWSTLVINKLHETNPEPAHQVIELLMRDYELQWLGCNTHFLFGVLTLATATGVNVWIEWGASLGRFAAFSAGSSVLLMMSLINDAVAEGSGLIKGGNDAAPLMRFGTSGGSLIARYAQLLISHAFHGKRKVLIAALMSGCLASYFFARVLFECFREHCRDSKIHDQLKKNI